MTATRRTKTLARALLVAATIAFTLTSTTLPSLAGDANAGDVWLETVGQTGGPGHEHDPHLPCADFDMWGAGLADAAGTFTIDSWPPSGGRQQVYASATSTASWQRTAGRAPRVIATVPVQVLVANAVAAGAHSTHQGFHFKLQLSQDPQKHKTFWLECPETQHPLPATGGGTPAGGSSGGGPTSGVGGTTARGPSGNSGPPGAGSAGGPAQPPGGETGVSAGVSSTMTVPSSPSVVPRTLPQTGSPPVLQSGPYLPSLPLIVLGILVAVRPRRWLRR